MDDGLYSLITLMLIFGIIATGILLGQSASEKFNFKNEYKSARGTIYKTKVIKINSDNGYVYFPKINFHYGGNETVYTDINGTTHVSFTGGHTCRMYPYCKKCSTKKSFAANWLDHNAFIGKTNTIYYKSGFKADLYGYGHYSTCTYDGWLQYNFDVSITLYSISAFWAILFICIVVNNFFGRLRKRSDYGNTNHSESCAELTVICGNIAQVFFLLI